MPYSFTQHVDDLHAHVGRLQQNAKLLAERLADVGEEAFARVLLANAHIHDASKWHGVEWEFLHQGPDVNRDMLLRAVAQHQATNPHHPEHWNGLRHMPRIFVAEMVCDWLARSQELATDFRAWVRTEAPKRFGFDTATEQVQWIATFTELLLPRKFA